MIHRKVELDLRQFPKQLQTLLAGREIYDSSCSSDAAVYYCDAGFYLKIDAPGQLAEEAAMAELFYRRGLGVEVLAYLTEERDYLLTRSAVGRDLTHSLEDPRALCRVLADSLRMLHSQSPEGVPLSARHRRYLESAGGDLDAGYYDECVLMKRYPIASKETAWRIMQQSKDQLQADTLIHGDACLPNLVAHDGRFSCFIDCSLAGVGDRHIDLYWALWSLQFNLKTEAYTDYFLDAYGRDGFREELLPVIAAFELFG